jgi:hypothetical protein
MTRIEPDTLALAVLTAALLLLGPAGEGLEAAPNSSQIAQIDAQPQALFPDGWAREFDLKRQRTIERLNGKMDQLRRKLERRERSPRFLLAADA